MAQCKAKSKRSGERCKRYATPGMDVCYIHGGKTPRGIALPQFKHGRYSKAMPARLLDKYHESQSDPRLLELAQDISLIDARLADVLARVDSGESGQLWQELRATHAAMLKAKADGDMPMMALKLNDLGTLIEHGLADYAAWSDVGRLLDQRRRFVESERKRLVEMQQMITSERAMVLLAAVVDTVRRHVTDRDALAAISADIGRLVAHQAGGAIGTDRV